MRRSLHPSTQIPKATGAIEAVAWPNREDEHRGWCRLTPLALSHADTQPTKDAGVALNHFADPVCGRAAPH